MQIRLDEGGIQTDLLINSNIISEIYGVNKDEFQGQNLTKKRPSVKAKGIFLYQKLLISDSNQEPSG